MSAGLFMIAVDEGAGFAAPPGQPGKNGRGIADITQPNGPGSMALWLTDGARFDVALKQGGPGVDAISPTFKGAGITFVAYGGAASFTVNPTATPGLFTIAATLPTAPSPWKPVPAAWATGTAYTTAAPASTVAVAGSTYVCASAPTAGASFAADLAAGLWVCIAAKGTDGAGSLVGPASAADGGIPLFDGTSGGKIKDSGIRFGTGAGNALRFDPTTGKYPPGDGSNITNVGFVVGDILQTTRNPGAGWLKCDGSAYLQSAYPLLYGVIKHTFAKAASAGNISAQASTGFGKGFFLGGNYVVANANSFYYGTSLSTTLAPGASFTGSVVGIAYDGTRFVLVTSSARCYAGAALNNLPAVNNPGGSPNGLAYGAGLFVTVGAGGAIYTTPNPVTTAWTPQASGTTKDLNAVVFASGLFVAVGTSGTIVTSPDGATWTARPSGTTITLGNVRYGNGTFLAFDQSASAILSTDAMAWGGAIDFPYNDAAWDGYLWALIRSYQPLKATVDFSTYWTLSTDLQSGLVGGLVVGGGRFAQTYTGDGGSTFYLASFALSYAEATQFPLPNLTAAAGSVYIKAA